ncbi:MAG: ATP F0F1 synthase subunit B [Pseudomonadota bacterium]
MEVFYNSTLVVGISLFLFLALLGYLGVHKLLGKMLDDRADGIRTELSEAKRLREEAQELFAEFERKQKAVEGQAQEIVAHAKAEAEAAAEKAKADLAVSIERRLKAADDQIALAESEAVKEVRDTAVSVAIAAAAQVLSERLGDDKAEGLVDSAIGDIGSRLH